MVAIHTAHQPRAADRGVPRARLPLVIDRRSVGAVLERGPRAVPSAIPILIDDPSLTTAEREAWQSRLTTLYNACGCHEGALGLVAAIPLLLALWLWPQRGFGLLEPGGLALLVGLPLFGAIGGKLLGLAVARVRLRRAVAELSALMRTRSSSDAGTSDGA